MDQEVFLNEIAMCKQLSQKNGGKCAWGECDKCGVIPLLFKLGKGEFYENVADVQQLRKDNLGL